MDETVPEITFDESGICSCCTAFLIEKSRRLLEDKVTQQKALESLIRKVRKAGKNLPYDCVIGVSGGVDSSWVLVQAVQRGLRPLAVHMDNGWNSELAQNNIANLVRGLGVDLETHVIDWREYRGLMQAFFDADVVDVELLYDNAMLAVNYRQAAKNKVKYILGGTNHATEGMRMPQSWNWGKFDKRNIQAIAGQFGNVQIRTFPTIGLMDRWWFQTVRRIEWVSILDYLDFNKEEAVATLQREFGYKPYPYKHYESVFTRFYQGFILPRKFGIDKRVLHLSTLILNQGYSRDDAVRLLERIPYPTDAELEVDRKYFLKKMGWSDVELQEYIGRPAKPHLDYGTSYRLVRLVRRFLS
jgi:N-acetyl sugar amidotransferase